MKSEVGSVTGCRDMPPYVTIVPPGLCTHRQAGRCGRLLGAYRQAYRQAGVAIFPEHTGRQAGRQVWPSSLSIQAGRQAGVAIWMDGGEDR